MTYAEELKMQGRQEGKLIGREEGKQAGLQEERQEIAKELLKSGVDSSIIIKATHLTLDQVEKLKKALD